MIVTCAALINNEDAFMRKAALQARMAPDRLAAAAEGTITKTERHVPNPDESDNDLKLNTNMKTQ